jgi:putative intracellular protease/amidase
MTDKSLARIVVMISPGGAGEKEFGHFLAVYYALRDAGAELVIASVSGGYPWPTGPKRRVERANELASRFQADRHARDDLANTLQLGQVFVEDFDAGFCIGAPGKLSEKGDRSSAGTLIARFLRAGKPVAVMPNRFELEPSSPT